MIYNIYHITGIQDPARKAIGNWFQTGFHSCCVHFLARDLDVGYVEFVLCELGTGDDKEPMTVGWYGVSGSLGIKAFTAFDDEIA